jgi:hypothetical protein
MTAQDDPQARREQIRLGLATVRDRIETARLAAGRTDPVDLVVVTKTFPASDVQILAELGVTDVGENRDQEASAKRRSCELDPPGLRWHMIGRLQRNKATSVARWADVVESVDRAEVALALSRSAQAAGRTLEILVQVALDLPPRPDRGGADPTTVPALAEVVADQPGLELRGVMGVAPFPGDPDEAFERLRHTADGLRTRWPGADQISAGMSGDLESAVRHGATQVRIGGAVLGERPRVQ